MDLVDPRIDDLMRRSQETFVCSPWLKRLKPLAKAPQPAMTDEKKSRAATPPPKEKRPKEELLCLKMS